MDYAGKGIAKSGACVSGKQLNLEMRFRELFSTVLQRSKEEAGFCGEL